MVHVVGGMNLPIVDILVLHVLTAPVDQEVSARVKTPYCCTIIQSFLWWVPDQVAALVGKEGDATPFADVSLPLPFNIANAHDRVSLLADITFAPLRQMP